MSKLKKVRGKIALLGGSLLAAGALGELMLRLLVPSPQPTFLRVNPEVGHWNRPGVQGYATVENVAFVKINSFGMHDDEYTLERTGKMRFAVLGDSFAEAFQVDLKDSFHSLLEEQYRERLEVLNFGVSGFSTAQCLLAYKHYVRQFRPDVVILCFNPRNDFLDNDRELSGGYSRPYFVLKDGELSLDSGFLDSEKHKRSKLIEDAYYFVTDRFILPSVLDKLRYRVGWTEFDRTQRSALEERSDGGGDFESSSHNLLYRPITEKDSSVWQVTEQLIVRLAKEVEVEGGIFVLFVTDSLPAQLDQDENQFYVEDRLMGFCSNQGVAAGEMGRRAVAEFAKSGQSVVGFQGRNHGHWNQFGHKVAFQELHRVLKEYDLLPREKNSE